jgi:hypothetical protein
MKSSFSHINPHDASQLGEDLMITAAAGAGVGLLSAAMGGMDHKVAGFTVPLDGLLSVALGVGALTAFKGRHARTLKIASIAVGGSAAVRTFEKFFKANLPASLRIRGEFEDLGHGYAHMGGHQQHRFHGLPQYNQAGYGYGAAAQDRLVEAAKYL